MLKNNDLACKIFSGRQCKTRHEAGRVLRSSPRTESFRCTLGQLAAPSASDTSIEGYLLREAAASGDAMRGSACDVKAVERPLTNTGANRAADDSRQ